MPDQPTPAPQTGGEPPRPFVMSITIYHPVADENVGLSLAVDGDYYCPQGPMPYITCVLKPPSGPSMQPLYLHYYNGHFEAYFENVTESDYTAKAIIKHDKNSPTEVQSTVSFRAQANPGLSINTPGPGVTVPASRNFEVKGTVDSQYANGNYVVSVYGTAGGNTIGGYNNVTPGNDGKWSATLSIPNQAGDVDIHADLWQNGGTHTITEAVIGRITIS